MKRLMLALTIVVMSLLFGCGGGGGGSSGSSSGSANTSTNGGTGGSAGTNDGGAGDTSGTPVPPPVVTIPGAPTEVSVQPGNGQVALSWSPVANATSYNVYWSTTVGVPPSQATRKTEAVSPCVVTGLLNGTTYYFAVTAVNQSGESMHSAEVSATPAAFFVAEMISGKSFDYTFSTGAKGVVSFNSDGTFTGENMSVAMPLTGQWTIKDGLLICVYPDGTTETIVLNSSASTTFLVTYFVSYADGSTSSSVEGTFNLK